LLKSVDRWEPLEKLFALAFLCENKMDRGSTVVQAISELFALRNAYVHAKSREINTVYHDNGKVLCQLKPGRFSKLLKSHIVGGSRRPRGYPDS
jgi:hypothetical protein